MGRRDGHGRLRRRVHAPGHRSLRTRQLPREEAKSSPNPPQRQAPLSLDELLSPSNGVLRQQLGPLDMVESGGGFWKDGAIRVEGEGLQTAVVLGRPTHGSPGQQITPRQNSGRRPAALAGTRAKGASRSIGSASSFLSTSPEEKLCSASRSPTCRTSRMKHRHCDNSACSH